MHSSGILTLADKWEIQELVAQYAYAIDHRQAQDWAELFTEDGQFISAGTLRARGREELIEYVKRAEQTGNQIRHWTCNMLVEGDSERARLRLYVMAIDVSQTIRPYLMGEYDDRVVKLQGRWKFEVRNVQFCVGKSWLDGGAPASNAADP